MLSYKLRLLLCLIPISVFVTSIQGEEREIYKLDKEVVVTASRKPLEIGQSARSVVVLDRNAIIKAPVRSVEELLLIGTGVDIRQRGPSGVQADISIRGGSFQQAQILVDGMKVNDPQTGHHNLDLPVTLDDISRVEVLKGPGSKLYGPNAMAGVVNIITESSPANQVRFKAAGGDFGLFERSLAISYNHGVISHRLNLGRRNSTGYRDNTEFDIGNISYRSDVRTGSGYVSFLGGYGEKRFGAHRFYSDAFPDQFESTETMFLSVRSDQKIGRASVVPRLFWRRHTDDFILDRNRPDWYRNQHTADQYGAEFQTGLEAAGGNMIVGAELAGEELESSNLGDRWRTRGGIFFEHQLNAISNFTFIPGFSVYNHSDWGWEFWPGVDLGYRPVPALKIHLTAGKSYRIPTFTELYYQSPANMGNPDLRPEESWEYEIGAGLRGRGQTADLSVFIRQGTDLIDWVKEDTAVQWQAENISENTVFGIEVKYEISFDSDGNRLPVGNAGIKYTYLNVEHSSGPYQSKYLLDHLQHQLIFNIGKDWQAWHYGFNLRYSQRYQGDDYFVADIKGSRKVGKLEIFADVTNLFNTSYSEIGTIPMPGRWFRVGLSYELGLSGSNTEQ
jgi:iron complex outermembrane receptor protein